MPSFGSVCFWDVVQVNTCVFQGCGLVACVLPSELRVMKLVEEHFVEMTNIYKQFRILCFEWEGYPGRAVPGVSICRGLGAARL